MASRTEYIAEVDAFLAAPKELAGEPVWADGNGNGDKRLVWPILVNGILGPPNVTITAYPNAGYLRFKVMLNLPPCIWRVDYDADWEGHHNPLDVAQHIGAYTVNGKHFHSWDDNRSSVDARNVRRLKLRVARELPENHRSFDSTFRWFCSEVEIDISGRQLPDLPPREGLL